MALRDWQNFMWCLSGRIFLAIVLAGMAMSGLQAQEAGDRSFDLEFTPPGGARGAQDLDLSFELDHAYTSRAVGKRKKWQLDTGQFNDDSPTYRGIEDPNLDSYSGVRLRLPRKR